VVLLGVMAMRRRGWVYGFLLLGSSAFAGEPARLEYVSATDFEEITVDLKQDMQRNPGIVVINVKLSPEARRRTAAITLLTINQPLSTFIDGRATSFTPSTVQSVIDGPYLQVAVPQDLLLKWLPWGRP